MRQGRWEAPALPPVLRTPMLVVAVAALVTLVVLAVVFAGSSDPRGFDRWAQATVTDPPAPWYDVALVVDFGGEPAGAAILVALVAGACVLAGKLRLAVLAVAGPCLCVVVTTGLKPLVGRTINGDFLSFPSGHTALLTAVALVLGLLVADLGMARRGRGGIPVSGASAARVGGAGGVPGGGVPGGVPGGGVTGGVPGGGVTGGGGLLVGGAVVYGFGLVCGAAMAWAQIALDAHYPTDTLGGFATALVCVPLVALVVDARVPHPGRRDPHSGR
ncbi:undecaprenyl-diphosphatase [Prauserella marina]|uniref:Undecaprenyl-diphosphatase n=1 Tax=Prauserella marina TaxID=530584 RepID=A0A1G6P081_9PSEU|nr:undecaprenyl-diphosphatase [Prauserella marina]SDC73612.1 undecaprenyl-diphosphatase [Prauserella marina]